MRHTAWPTISEQAQMAAAPPRTPTSVTGCRPRTRPSTSMKPSSPGDRAPHRWMRPTRVPEGPLEIRVPTDVENVRLNSRKPSVAKVDRVRAVAQPGSALRSGRRGREFKSPQPDYLVVSTPRILVRPARPADAAVVATIWNEGIAGREATFEVRPRELGEITARLGDRLPLVVAELGGVVVGFGLLSAYSERPVYAGVGEASVYVTESARGRGIGTQLIEALVEQAEMRGMHKLIGKLFASNE